MKITNLILSALLVASACSSSASNQQKVPYRIQRFIDDEAGVVCWYSEPSTVAMGGAPYTISCLPISETKLVYP